MTKILTAKKYLSNDPNRVYAQENIHERFLVFHGDWRKFDKLQKQFIEDGYDVRVYEVKEEDENVW